MNLPKRATVFPTFSRVLPKALWPSGVRLYGLVALLSFGGSAIIGARIPQHIARVHDEFGYLLAGQTFARFELTNPTHPLWRFFETHHILMHPSYMAKYLPGHGLMVAVGYLLGSPIAGVWIESALLAVSVTWLLRGFFSPRWALFGGLLTIVQFGLAYYWTQTFWGGALAAAGGALVFGGARRVWSRRRVRDAILLGAGVAILVLTRPFEGALACLVPAAIVLVRCFRDGRSDAVDTFLRLILPAGLVILAALTFLAYYNFRVTGNPWRLPYLEYESQYSGSPTFIWQHPRPDPTFVNPSMADYYREYVVPLSRFYSSPGQVFTERLRLTAWNFLGIVLLPFTGAALVLRPTRWTLVAALSLLACSLAMILSYWFSSHYQGVAAPLYIFLAVIGIRRTILMVPSASKKFCTTAMLALLVGQSVSVGRDHSIDRSLSYYQSPDRRQKIIDALVATGDQHIVFVRREPPVYIHLSWVFNDANIDQSPVIWAWDRGPEENQRLLSFYPKRRAVIMTVQGERVSFAPLAAEGL